MQSYYEFDREINSVFTLLTDPQFLVDRCLELGELEAECEAFEEEDSTVIKIKRTVQRDMPAFMAKLSRSSQKEHIMHLEMTETWTPDNNGGWNGEARVEFGGQPVSIYNSYELYPTDSGCCYTVTHRAKVKIPLIARKIEKYIVKQAEDGFVKQVDFLRKKLA